MLVFLAGPWDSPHPRSWFAAADASALQLRRLMLVQDTECRPWRLRRLHTLLELAAGVIAGAERARAGRGDAGQALRAQTTSCFRRSSPLSFDFPIVLTVGCRSQREHETLRPNCHEVDGLSLCWLNVSWSTDRC